MSPKRIVERERRWAPWVALAAGLPVLLYIGSILIEQAAGIELGETEGPRFRSIDENPGALLAGALISAVGFLLITIPLTFLFRAVRARNENVPSVMVGFAVIAPVLFAAQAIFAYVAQLDIARDFVELAPVEIENYEQLEGEELTSAEDDLVEDLADDSQTSEIARSLLFPAVLGMIIGAVYIPLQAMRIGLLTRFFATLGMALGASLLLILPMALLGLLMWIAALGFVILGKGRSGLYPAWEQGVAVPWPKPGDESSDEEEPEAPGEPEELDASELIGTTEDDGTVHGTQGQRRKKRKKRS